MEYKNILLTFEGEIGILTINRAKSLNALNIETLKEIQIGIQEVKDRSDLKVLIISNFVRITGGRTHHFLGDQKIGAAFGTLLRRTRRGCWNYDPDLAAWTSNFDVLRRQSGHRWSGQE